MPDSEEKGKDEQQHSQQHYLDRGLREIKGDGKGHKDQNLGGISGRRRIRGRRPRQKTYQLSIEQEKELCRIQSRIS